MPHDYAERQTTQEPEPAFDQLHHVETEDAINWDRSTPWIELTHHPTRRRWHDWGASTRSAARVFHPYEVTTQI